MAGIGFVLRKLARQDNLLGIFQAYLHSAMASTGPWLFTVLCLGTIVSISKKFVSYDTMLDFKIIIIYNFAFSLIVASPVYMVMTRYLADCIHKKDVTSASGLLVGSLLILHTIQVPAVSYFYLGYAELDDSMAYAAIINFMLISTIWVIAVFISALKDYKSITRAFGVGLGFSALAGGFFAQQFGAVGMLHGFSVGLALIITTILAKILMEYPYCYKHPFEFLPYFRKYWELAVGGLVYNMAVWSDKWIMWFSPEAQMMPNKLVIYPNYDSAMFLAYLTIVPAMALFLFNIETNFFEQYIRFYRDIQDKVTYNKIKRNHFEILRSIFSSSKNFVIFQVSICTMTILMAPRIFQLLGINFLQMGIFRFGVLGVLFHVFTLFFMIILSYFDNRRAVLYMQALLFLTNTLFTFISMKLGFSYYGYGYFLSALVTFVALAIVTVHYVASLPYHTFVTTNVSVK